ncbi:GH25 family lysozyme [Sphingobacterium sp. UT-1RO-CII-1]|uniref:glycoside hydrolase family 25 protein n=1 Tax=Sphingobacterium sp. UT-1RO-CII-1 TaxID=2995225 RepID=UPI00227C1290|nr:GH25 family lysozyme [Sphingobacterium sp. UT-1RO-CII-1]MCY4779119.1 GH25 family lysozyme [Sphingobacterium sp. UT-1RO-CII-1]
MGKTTRVKAKKPKVPAKKIEQRKYLLWSILLPFVAVLLIVGLLFRTEMSYTLKHWFYGQETIDNHTENEHYIRNVKLIQEHDSYIYGIDVSQYQGPIKWNELHNIHGIVPVDFVFIRATMGEEALDKRFIENWKGAHKRTKLRGAYHYFRPNENSLKQARNFINNVKLSGGDLPPVLDIEERPKRQSMDSLKIGLKRWLFEVEKHYGIQPILYSGDSYFTDFLQKEFSNYVLWIANYNFWVDEPKKHWNFWQFSERGAVSGIEGNVDLNMFKGNIEKLEELTIPY